MFNKDNYDFEAYSHHTSVNKGPFQMSLLLLGDSNVERVWLNVRNNRDLLRGAMFVAVKRFDQLHTGFQALHPSVSNKQLLELL